MRVCGIAYTASTHSQPKNFQKKNKNLQVQTGYPAKDESEKRTRENSNAHKSPKRRYETYAANEEVYSKH